MYAQAHWVPSSDVHGYAYMCGLAGMGLAGTGTG
jgi:hypothetical protein